MERDQRNGSRRNERGTRGETRGEAHRPTAGAAGWRGRASGHNQWARAVRRRVAATHRGAASRCGVAVVCAAQRRAALGCARG
eukprot:4141777-Prymnesium_polylepis.1